MKIRILKPCTTPEGRHSPGDTVETSEDSGSYLVANGYAASGSVSAAPSAPPIETATAPMTAAESATIETRKTGRPKSK